jgi:hypothetical protein
LVSNEDLFMLMSWKQNQKHARMSSVADFSSSSASSPLLLLLLLLFLLR